MLWAAMLVALPSGACAGAHHAASTTSPTPSAAATRSSLPSHVQAEIPLPGGPARLGSGFGSIWVGALRGTTLYRVDPRTNTVVARIPTRGKLCGTPIGAYGRVLVAYCDPPGMLVVDPATNHARPELPSRSLTVASLDGKLWMPDPFDPKTLRRIGPVHVDAQEVQAAAGAVWGVDTDNQVGNVARISPATGKVTARYAVGDRDTAENLSTVHAGKIWLYGGRTSIWQLDPRSGRATEHRLAGLEAGARYGTFAFGAGSLWVNEAQTLHRYALPSLRPTATYVSGLGPQVGGFVDVAFGSVWVTHIDGDALWRIRP
jgi:streptogramin lyase